MIGTLFLCFSFVVSADIRPRLAESEKDRLQRLYKDHKVRSYDQSRTLMYNTIDCESDAMWLVYSGTTFDWKCGQTSKPSATYVNAEHTVPQSTFAKKLPMVSDLHHIYPAASKLNSVRSNYKFTEVSYDQCAQFCRDMTCGTSRPSNPDDYSCLTTDKFWMPRKEDRGALARGILYFYTMYDDYPITDVGTAELFLKWNRQFPPTQREKVRNDLLNKTQGNRNPFTDDPSLADKVFN